jgi:hypothetical protein
MLAYLLFASGFNTSHAMYKSDVRSRPSGGDQIKVLGHPDTRHPLLLVASSQNNYIYAVPMVDIPNRVQGQCAIPSISSADLEQNGLTIFADPRDYRVIAN